MTRKFATAARVDRDALVAFLQPRHRGLLATTRRDGRPQLSPVTCGVDDLGGPIAAGGFPPELGDG
jgi:hypothetical protein